MVSILPQNTVIRELLKVTSIRRLFMNETLEVQP